MPLGIIDVINLSKNQNKELHICKAVCKDKESVESLLKHNIKIGHHTFHTERVINNPLQCFNCFKFNHIAHNCQDRAICGNCGADDCNDLPKCIKIPKCSNCGESHHAKSKKCNTFLELNNRNRQIRKKNCKEC